MNLVPFGPTESMHFGRVFASSISLGSIEINGSVCSKAFFIREETPAAISMSGCRIGEVYLKLCLAQIAF